MTPSLYITDLAPRFQNKWTKGPQKSLLLIHKHIIMKISIPHCFPTHWETGVSTCAMTFKFSLIHFVAFPFVERLGAKKGPEPCGAYSSVSFQIIASLLLPNSKAKVSESRFWLSPDIRRLLGYGYLEAHTVVLGQTCLSLGVYVMCSGVFPVDLSASCSVCPCILLHIRVYTSVCMCARGGIRLICWQGYCL